MEKNLKKREFLEADKPLAQACPLNAKMDAKFAHLVAPFSEWVNDINTQLAAFE